MGGKNLFNKNSITNHKYVNSSGEIADFTETETADYAVSGYIPVFSNKQITISGMVGDQTIVGYAQYDSYKNYISGGKYKADEKVTFTTDKRTKYIVVTCGTKGSVDSKDTLQVEYGSNATKYSEYMEPETVNEALTTQLNYENQVADSYNYKTNALKTMLGTVTFTGEENWNTTTGVNIENLNEMYSTSLSGANKSPSKALCTYYNAATGNISKKDTVYVKTQDGYDLHIVPLDYQTVTSWVQFLTTKNANGEPFKCVYELAEPTTTTQSVNRLRLRKGTYTINMITNIKPSKIEFSVVELIKEI
jgi:hypothetical protein